MTPLVWIIGIAGTAAAVWCFIRARGPIIARIIQGLLPLAAAGLLFMLLARVVQTSTGEWNDAKLAPVVAITKDYPLYPDPVNGVMTGWIYGPWSALVYLPATLGSHPTTVGIIGSTIAAFCYFVPTAWLLLIASRGRAPMLALAGLLVVGWRAVAAEDLCRAVFIAGPDAIALGLATTACAVIYSGRTLLTMTVSALAVALCIWTKHSFAPLAAGLLAYVAITDGLNKSAAYLALLAGAATILSTLFLALFGVSNMWYHMVTLPSSHPFDITYHSMLEFWCLSALVLFMTCIVALALLVLVLLLDNLFVQSRQGGVRSWFASRPWSMLVLAALALAPLSLASYMKIGGYVNNLAAPNHFLLMAALAGLLDICARASDDSFARTRLFLESALAMLAILLGLRAMIGTSNGAADSWPLIARPYENNTEKLFGYVRAHPAEVYCPWNPLITLLAEGKLYHFEWGFLDELNAKHDPNAARLRKHVPARARLVVYLRTPQSTVIHERLNSHRRRVELPVLPGCIVFVE